MATKQLARELGLLKKRSSIALSPQFSAKRQKTIEFPAVLLNTKTGRIESEFHYFLQPSERPYLSDFCQNLTGITQDQVDNGIPLLLCLKKFVGWLRKLHEDFGLVCAGGENFGTEVAGTGQGCVAALVTWSDWDLGVCLLNETRRKQITKPAALDAWIDLKATYKAFYGRKPDGLNGALMELGIKFDGRQHSGLDDSRNTARLAWRMICDGCVMAITKTLRMSSAGKMEQLSFPPLGPVCSIIQTSRQVNNHGRSEDKMSIYTQARTTFPIAQDEKHARVGLTRLDHNAKQGLSERNINLLTAPDISVKDRHFKKECGTEVFTCHLKNEATSDISFIEQRASLEIKENQQRKCTSKIPISSVRQKSIQNKDFQQKQGQITSKTGQAHICSDMPVCENLEIRSGTFVQSPPNDEIDNAHASPKIGLSLLHSVTPAAVSSLTWQKACSLSVCIAATEEQELLNATASPGPDVTRTDSVSCLQQTPVTNLCASASSFISSRKMVLSVSPSSSVSAQFKMPAKNSSHTGTVKTPITSSRAQQQWVSPHITPPFCGCGRRSKCWLVQNQGPNNGRWFFSCSSGNRTNSGCKFFQWVSPHKSHARKSLKVKS